MVEHFEQSATHHVCRPRVPAERPDLDGRYIWAQHVPAQLIEPRLTARSLAEPLLPLSQVAGRLRNFARNGYRSWDLLPLLESSLLLLIFRHAFIMIRVVTLTGEMFPWVVPAGGRSAPSTTDQERNSSISKYWKVGTTEARSGLSLAQKIVVPTTTLRMRPLLQIHLHRRCKDIRCAKVKSLKTNGLCQFLGHPSPKPDA
jgi:hypothetical protein